MNWKLFDSLRRQSNPLENNLIEAYAANRISRRDFVKRGTIIGLGIPTMTAVLAACGTDAETGADGENATSGDTDAAAGAVPGSGSGGHLNVGIQFGDANSGLDPINMVDLGTYAVLSQSFEYLVDVGPDGNIGTTGIAESWSPNEDGTVWTFTLRDGVMWHDGSPLTSAAVAASIDRMVAAGSGLTGIISEGAVETPDDRTAVINLDAANGNLPVLLSIFNPQSLITPVDYSEGITLDARPAGSGPWIFESFDPRTFNTVFRANENYWGGRPVLDSISLQGFANEDNKVLAMQQRNLDVLIGFGTVAGASLLDDENFTVMSPPSANHRQLWFNTQLPENGPFSDPRVRQAIGYCLDRQQMVDTLFDGRGIVANDHPVHPTLPFFDADATPQRPRDIEMAKQLLADAGHSDLTAILQAGEILASPEMAAIVEQNCAEAGIALSVNVTPQSNFYGEFWCTGQSTGPTLPCGSSAAIGIVDYGHRPVPDIFLTRALRTDGDWNSSNYTNPEFDQLVTDYEAAIDVEGQKAAISSIQKVLHQDAPALYPFFFDYLAGHDNSIKDVQVTALGHVKLERATRIV